MVASETGNSHIKMYLSWLYGEARVSFCHAAKTIRLPSKNSNNEQSNDSERSLLDICKQTSSPCRLNPFLFNGHLQTCWTALRKPDIPIHYKRKVFTSAHQTYQGIFAVDFVVPPPPAPQPNDPELPERTHFFTDEEFSCLGSDDEKPMVVLLHGLSGGSYESYLRQVLRPLVQGSEWEACVVNSRGCARSKITSPVLYNARATWDIRQTVEWIREKWPRRRLFGVGFSLGANILVNYLGEEGTACKLDAAVVICNPWNLETCNLALQQSWIGLKLYSATMGSNMKALFERHVEQLSKNPNIDIDKVRKSRYLHEFDRYVQCPSWGYPTEFAYYRDASSADSVLAVRVPLLAIHAEDDPIAVDTAVPRGEIKLNSNVVLCSTSMGGHLSWFELGGDRWFSRVAAAFLKQIATGVDWVAMSKRRTDFANGDLLERSKLPSYDPMRRKLHGASLPGV